MKRRALVIPVSIALMAIYLTGWNYRWDAEMPASWQAHLLVVGAIVLLLVRRLLTVGSQPISGPVPPAPHPTPVPGITANEALRKP